MIELCLLSACKTAEPNLQRSTKVDKDDELQRKIKSISSHNFALAVIKATNDIIIYVLCEGGDERKFLEELFASSQHRAALLEELIKSSKSNTKARSLLECEVLQLIQDILPNVGHSGIVLQTGAYCGHKRELGKVSDSSNYISIHIIIILNAALFLRRILKLITTINTGSGVKPLVVSKN